MLLGCLLPLCLFGSRNESLQRPEPLLSVDLPAIVSPYETPDTLFTTTQPLRYRRPLALKTNLLFDLATALNAELEVPLNPRFSLMAEITFPWWLWNSEQTCFEVVSGGLEARYWFKPRYRRQDASLGRHNPLTGWFTGLYGGAGYYDLEWKGEGYQGEFFIAAGISLGYTAPLSRNFSMEFSVGVGYLQTEYRHYHAKQSVVDDSWHLVRQNDGIQTWIGPTKAKLSLVWYPHFKRKKKGGRP